MRRILSLVAVLVVALPAAARAQTATSLVDAPVPAVGTAAVAPPSEAPRSLTAAGQQALSEVRLEAAAARGVPGMAPGKSFGQAEALMIVGGAAVLGGILVGGNVGYVVSVVGLGVGLYGLWMYLR